MTWTKLSDDFSDQCRGLSDPAFRTHVEGLLWTMRRETGGYLELRDVTRFSESPHAQMAVGELVACGWWSIDGDGYRINHHMEHQPEPDVLSKRRDLDAERQRRARRRRAGMTEEAVVRQQTSRRDNTRDPGRDGTGRENQKTAVTKSRKHTSEGDRDD